MDRIRRNIIFFKGSKKYFLSTLIIPPSKRHRITILYNFSRYIDDIVDIEGYTKEQFSKFQSKFFNSYENNQVIGDLVIDDFIKLSKEWDLPLEWIEALFRGIEMDLKPNYMDTCEETLDYTYCVAEVIGLMVCKICQIEEEAYPYAQYAGRAGQWANFLRDAFEDYSMERIYLPRKEFDVDFILPITDQKMIVNIRKQIENYWFFRQKAKLGYRYLPSYLKISVEYAAKIDDFIVSSIEKDPSISFDKKFKFKKAVTTNLFS